MARSERYWYSLIGARPIPESGETVNIAIAFGNGTLINIDFDERLSRLQGLVSADHRALYSQMLHYANGRIPRGVTLDELALTLGPQFLIGNPRELQVEYSDQTVRALRAAYLSPSPSPREQSDSFLKHSLRRLDHFYREVEHGGVEYVRGKLSLADLYEHKLDRYVTVKVPPIRRMIRADRRDVLLNTLIIRPDISESVIDNHVARVSRQFYAFRELKSRIQEHAGKDVRRVGMIQPLRINATRPEIELSNWAAEVWAAEAEVFRPQNTDEIRRDLKILIDWSRAA